MSRAGVPLIAVIGIAGCAASVHPSSDELVARLTNDSALFDRRYLERRGFDEVSGSGYPLLADGSCFEKARAHPLYGGFAGVDVVRVCLGARNLPALVFTMHTHGEPWTEVYPNDMRNAAHPHDFSGRISEETKKRLSE